MADRANVQDSRTVVAAGARPTVAVQGSRVVAMVIRDEGRETWVTGTYRLLVYCAGTGTLYAHFTLGSTALIKELPPCAPTVATGVVDLRLTAAATGSTVIIIPVGDAQAGVAYQIQRV